MLQRTFRDKGESKRHTHTYTHTHTHTHTHAHRERERERERERCTEYHSLLLSLYFFEAGSQP